MSLPMALGALLLAGHALGEFVTGPEGRGAAPQGGAARVKHAGAMLLWHLLLLLPLVAGGHASVLIALLVVVPGHLLVDWAVDHLPFPEVRTLERILVDQLAHLAVLWGATALALSVPWSASVPEVPLDLTLPARFGLMVAAFALNWGGGAAVVHGVLARFRMPEDMVGRHGESVAGSGRAIGILERTLLLPLVILGEWGGIGFIIAAKSLARFKELDSRPFAEYYLIGTLTSVLVATITGMVVRGAFGL